MRKELLCSRIMYQECGRIIQLEFVRLKMDEEGICYEHLPYARKSK